MQNKPEMFKLKIGDRCWSADILGEVYEWDLQDSNAILREDENLLGIGKLIKEQTLASRLLKEMYGRE